MAMLPAEPLPAVPAVEPPAVEPPAPGVAVAPGLDVVAPLVEPLPVALEGAEPMRALVSMN
jgi:hypothetical protein